MRVSVTGGKMEVKAVVCETAVEHPDNVPWQQVSLMNVDEYIWLSQKKGAGRFSADPRCTLGKCPLCRQ